MWKCIQCGDYLCDECADGHRKGKKSRYHRLLHFNDREEEDEIRFEVFCRKHTDKEIQMFCYTDNKMMCSTCASEEHKGHDVKLIEIRAEQVRTNVGKVLTEVDKTVPEYTDAIRKLDTLASEIDRREQQNVSSINAAIEKQIATLREKQRILCKQEADAKISVDERCRRQTQRVIIRVGKSEK